MGPSYASSVWSCISKGVLQSTSAAWRIMGGSDHGYPSLDAFCPGWADGLYSGGAVCVGGTDSGSGGADEAGWAGEGI